MSNTEKWNKWLKDYGLAHKAEQIAAYTRSSIRMVAKQNADEEIPIGHSKIGGCPDVPTDFVWPYTNDKRPLYFLCQLHVKDIKSYDTNNLLPTDGLLSFFYDAAEQPWGYDPKDYDGFNVFYFTEPVSSLTRIKIPAILLQHGDIASASLQFKNEWTLPPWESPFWDDLEETLTEEEADNLRDLAYESMEEADANGAVHRIDGFPDAIQGDMYLQCQLVSNGLYCGDSTGYNDPLRRELEAGATDWRLLLQLDSEEELGYMWGDSGRLYFWIREDDCQKTRFDQTWVVLQCF